MLFHKSLSCFSRYFSSLQSGFDGFHLVGVDAERMGQSLHVPQIQIETVLVAQAAITEYHTPTGLDNVHSFPYGCGHRMSEIKVPPG